MTVHSQAGGGRRSDQCLNRRRRPQRHDGHGPVSKERYEKMARELFTISAVQLEVIPLNPERNLAKMVEHTEREANAGARLVIFPELSNTGYVKGREKEFGREYYERAEPIPGPSTEALGAVARRRGVYVIAGLCQRHPEIPGTLYNSAVLIAPSGNILGVHHKIHIPGQEKHFFCAGNGLDVYKTELGCIGMLVCYDGLFPEASRILALKGAELICIVYNSPFRPGTIPVASLEHNAATRASENKLFVATCNKVGTDVELPFLGRSAIAAPNGEIIALGPEREEAAVRAEIRLDQIVEERAFFSVFRDRRPELYAKICELL